MKKLLTLLVATFIALSFGLSVEAKGNDAKPTPPESILIFEEEITVDAKGGKFQVEFVEIHFLNRWLEQDELPITFTVKLYAEDGEVYVEIIPDVEAFNKHVFFRTTGYSGYIYDIATGENIYVDVPRQQFKVEHFSRYCWAI